jgi:DNA-binding NarL/FixJ family response regulator
LSLPADCDQPQTFASPQDFVRVSPDAGLDDQDQTVCNKSKCTWPRLLLGICSGGERGSRDMKFLMIDDHALIRDALRGVLTELIDDATISEASNYRQAARLLEQNPNFSMILLDLHLPDRSGLTVLAELRQRYPAISIVVLSAFNDYDNVVKALNLGALAFIPKSAERAVMLGALRFVLAGGTYIPPDILNRGSSVAMNAPPIPAVPGAKGQPVSPADLGLTERQVEVLAHMIRGLSNKAICRKFDLAERTVKNHVTAILRALKATNRTEAAFKVKELGWVLPRCEDHGS